MTGCLHGTRFTAPPITPTIITTQVATITLITTQAAIIALITTKAAIVTHIAGTPLGTTRDTVILAGR
jgi:hypothetical protein